MEKVFVDTDIVLDLLSNREPFYSHSAQLFSEADKGKIRIHKVFYFIQYGVRGTRSLRIY